MIRHQCSTCANWEAVGSSRKKNRAISSNDSLSPAAALCAVRQHQSRLSAVPRNLRHAVHHGATSLRFPTTLNGSIICAYTDHQL